MLSDKPVDFFLQKQANLSYVSASSSSPPGGGAPPWPWYSLAMMGCTMSSISFFCAFKSSAEASVLSSKLLLVTELVLQTVGIAFQFISGLDLALQSSVFLSKLLRIVDHSLDILGAQSVVVVSDGNLLLVAGALVLGRHN